MDHLEKQSHGDKPGGFLTIKCKDLKVVKIDIQNQEEFAGVADSIEKLSAIGELLALFCNLLLRNWFKKDQLLNSC